MSELFVIESVPILFRIEPVLIETEPLWIRNEPILFLREVRFILNQEKKNSSDQKAFALEPKVYIFVRNSLVDRRDGTVSQ